MSGRLVSCRPLGGDAARSEGVAVMQNVVIAVVNELSVAGNVETMAAATPHAAKKTGALP